MSKESLLKLIWRGALGGALGGFLYYLLILFKLWPDVPYFGLTLLILPVSGLIIGGMIGAVIWILGRATGRRLNLILRIVVGVVLAALFGGAVFFFSNRDESIEIKALITGTLSMGVTFGLLAGMMARGEK